MRPIRKSRSVNKWHDYFSQIYPVKDIDNSKRNNNQKRKLSDTPQWSKEELSRFYEAYREYGKDWKKVAAVVRNRSVEMVEALYTMNRAYLSLPEGTASVDGLIAMMSDHYSNLARSDSEQECNDGSVTSRKRARGKSEPSDCKASDRKFNAHPQTTAPNFEYLSLMNTNHTGGSRPHAARKRTPRLPVSSENIKGEKFLLSIRQSLKKKTDVNGDADEIKLVLTEALAKGSSPQVSLAPNKRTNSVISSPAQSAEMKCTELKMANAKSVESDRDDEDLEGSRKADTGELPRHSTYLKQSGQVGTLVQKSRSINGKKLDADDNTDSRLDDQTEIGQRLGALHEKLNRGAKFSRSSLQGSRKKSRRFHFSRDEASAIEALQTLAELPLKVPSGGNENESVVHIKEEKADHLHESGSLQAMPGKCQRDKHRSSGVRVKGDRSISRFEVASNKKSKSNKISAIDDNTVPEMEKEAYQPKTTRKKSNILTPKIWKSESHLNNQLSEISEYEARDIEKMSKSKRSSQNALPKLMKDAEHSSRTHPQGEGSDPAQSSVQVCQANQNGLPTRVRSRRKMHLSKPQKQKDLQFPNNVLNGQSNTLIALVDDTAFTLKDKLINCLSNPQLRRWCIYEWFYSAIDYPWFAQREFVQYLYHVGLGHVPKLTRVEWGVIRSSLGKPRRFSQQFLKEEKQKVDEYRDSVRKHYTDLRKGIQEGLPKDLTRPLSVGQRAITIHPKQREIHDGNVLTVNHSRCRVQFDQPELGVEFVKDIDCMPLNYLDNIPTPLVRHITSNKFFEKNELRMSDQLEEYTKAFPGDEMENIDGLPHLPRSTYPTNNPLKLTKVASEDANVQTRIVPTETSAYQEIVHSHLGTLAQIQANDADVQSLAELTCALDKKEAVVFELKHVNNELVDNCSLKESDPFQKQYAAALVQLQEANEQVSSSLSHLGQRNALQETDLLPWPGSVADLGDHVGPLNSLDHSACQPHVSGSHVIEIIESSRTKARTMVHVAMQTMSSLKGRENARVKIDEAIDIVNKQLPLDDSFILLAPDPMLTVASDSNGAQIPSELITQCVATLLMIQKCTERQFPPADIAQILHSAVISLKPSYSQNLPAYAEIQKYMEMIKNQILSLLPA